jgi:hypothetical protein
MSEDLDRGTTADEHEKPAQESPNTKLHGEPPPGSPMPGVEREEKTEVKQELNPNTE